ncbi:RNA polymerase sigma factor [Mariniblastus fucicola]|uniref:RNA polymerase sigma factor n=1 Tax=Mariniblastus fucicola TaxID=980251 RepID=A0A5B9P7S1_9BACT|nr:sigma-70 family RNA polymerase sigma factor [Mariniblastus fucicola]QEG21559.1 RNA polymerase sigma factor [Mariniblastus fucicola]
MPDSFRSTIVNAQKGESSAVELIVAEFSDLIQRECSRYGLRQHPELSHADLYQETLVHVLRQINHFSQAEASEPRAAFEQWVRVTTRNRLSNLERHRNARKRFPANGFRKNDGAGTPPNEFRGTSKTASSIFENDEKHVRLKRAMNSRIDKRGKEVLLLRVVEGLTLKQIAICMSLSYDQVRYSYDQSLAELQKHLDR